MFVGDRCPSYYRQSTRSFQDLATRSTANEPCRSVAPMTWPPGVPPPANKIDMALAQWSRPALALTGQGTDLWRASELTHAITMVVSSKPRLVEVLDQRSHCVIPVGQTFGQRAPNKWSDDPNAVVQVTKVHPLRSSAGPTTARCPKPLRPYASRTASGSLWISNAFWASGVVINHSLVDSTHRMVRTGSPAAGSSIRAMRSTSLRMLLRC